MVEEEEVGGGFQNGAPVICGRAAVVRQDAARPLFYCFT